MHKKPVLAAQIRSIRLFAPKSPLFRRVVWSLLGASICLSSAPAAASLAARVLLPADQGSGWLEKLPPADPFCSWSRLQVPTAVGLRWVAEEHCDQDGQ
jgi:hypothetical protein